MAGEMRLVEEAEIQGQRSNASRFEESGARALQAQIEDKLMRRDSHAALESPNKMGGAQTNARRHFSHGKTGREIFFDQIEHASQRMGGKPFRRAADRGRFSGRR